MKKSFTHASPIRAVCALSLAALLPLAPSLFAGAPVKSPDTSTSAESRIPITATTTPGDATSLFRITQSGSYFLTGNITGVAGKHGISIAADGITIDLNGFNLEGVAGSLDGINQTVPSPQLTVRNGTIRGWRFGIFNASTEGQYSNLRLISNVTTGLSGGLNTTVTDCVASDNGEAGVLVYRCSVVTRVTTRHNRYGIQGIGHAVSLIDCTAGENTTDGIFLNGDTNTLVGCTAMENTNDGFRIGGTSSLERCTARDNGIVGFQIGSNSTLTHCTAFLNNGIGFSIESGSVMVDSAASFNTQDGYSAGANVRIENCTAMGNGRYGFWIGFASMIRGSLARNNGMHGINADGQSHIEGNHLVSNGTGAPGTGAGIYLASVGNRVEGNSCNLNGVGIRTDVANNFFVRNSARGNLGGNYILAAGSESGQIITNPGVNFVSSNPWANFAY